MRLLLSLLVIAGLTACDQKGSTDSTKERAAAEQEGANKAENENLAKKAAAMEQDLAKRHFFYGSVEGEYEGTMSAGSESYRIKFTFARSIPPYTDDRVRQLSEIENDLNNLYFYMQVVQWHPDDQSSAVGCRVSGIRPNMNVGELTVASTECPNLYSIHLSENGEVASGADTLKNSTETAQKVKSLSMTAVPFLVGTVQPSSNAGKYYFSVKKVK